jgi:methionyl aminopeptidase
MVNVKSKSDLEKMRKAGRIAGQARELAGESICAGMSTLELDKIIHDYIVSCGAVPSFLGYGGFPGSACISINEEVIHGIPNKKRIMKNGDIVSVDVGACIDGFHGDTCATFTVGKVSETATKLLEVTKASLYKAIEQAVVGNRLGDVCHAVEEYVTPYGYGIVRNYTGHGVGRKLHEAPEVPNYGTAGRGIKLVAGMTFAIEPMINVKGDGVRTLANGWTVITNSGSLSAHFEHTIAVTPSGPIILTEP